MHLQDLFFCVIWQQLSMERWSVTRQENPARNFQVNPNKQNPSLLNGKASSIGGK